MKSCFLPRRTGLVSVSRCLTSVLAVVGLAAMAGASTPVAFTSMNESELEAAAVNNAMGIAGWADAAVRVNVSSADWLRAQATENGVQIVWSSILVPGLFTLTGPDMNVQALLGALKGQPQVRYAQLSEVCTTSAQTRPYGVDLVAAPTFWAGTGVVRGAGAKVAVLDTGIAINHPDLPVPLITQSFIAGESVNDGNSHGTHCAGTILALDNDDGVVGVAPQATLVVAKVLANSGSGSTAGIIQGIEWATLQGVQVVSMSLGGGGFEQAFQDIITAANASGVSVAASAGNSASASQTYPAWYNGVISVGAVDSNSAIAGFSNFGPNVSIVGPGVSVLSTVPNVRGVTWSGTTRQANTLAGSGAGTITGAAIFCGTGGVASDFPPEVLGNIAHIRRGGTDALGATFTFRIKVDNAIAAGATAVIVSNNNGGLFSGTIGTSVAIPVLGISQSNGDVLQAASGVQATVSTDIPPGGTYGTKSGTSMSCPHVAGVLALLWGEFIDEGLTPALVRTAIEQSAVDLGVTGRDDTFGYGLINAPAARAWLRTNLPARCLADLVGGNGNPPRDGTIDGNDFTAFLNAFAASSSLADLVGGDGNPPVDGQVDGNDFSAFLNAFGVGC